MVDHHNVIITLTLILPMVTLLIMADTHSSAEYNPSFEVPYAIQTNQIATPVDRVARFMRQLAGRDGRTGSPHSRLVDYAIKRLQTMNDDVKLSNQFDNLPSIWGVRGANNWKREGAETYKNMFLGVRG